MKVLSIILKIIETGIACIWGVFFGIVFPVCILCFGSDIIAADIAESPVIIAWLITAVAGYVLPAALIIIKKTKTAAALSLLGFIGVLIVNVMFAELYKYTTDSNGPVNLYMPLMFATILDIAIAVIDNRHLIKVKLEKNRKKEDEKAPSILSDD